LGLLPLREDPSVTGPRHKARHGALEEIMTRATCKCSHEKRDHRALSLALNGYGACKVCLCDQYTKPKPADLMVAVPSEAGLA
jgi:hypothetical protein